MDDILQAVLDSEAEEQEAKRRADEAKNLIHQTTAAWDATLPHDPDETEKAMLTIAAVDPVYGAHFRAMAAGARCTECPLYGCRRGPVPGDVVPDARLTIIGEAPGKNEVEDGRPFIGASGRELDEALDMGGLERKDCTITNTVLCRPPPKESMESYLTKLNRQYNSLVKKTKAENKERKKRGEAEVPVPKKPPTPIECCAPRLKREIETSNTKTILAVGGRALSAMADHFGVPYAKGKDVVGEIKIATIMNQHGAPVPFPKGHKMADGTVLEDDMILCSSLHPAFAMRGSRHYKQVIRDDITRAATIVRRGNKIDWHEPDYHLFIKGDPGSVTQVDPEDAIKKIEEICYKYVANKSTVAYDIETDSKYPMTCRVRCVGMGAVVDGKEEVIVIPFRWMDGREYWPRRDLKRRAAMAVRDVLDNCKLIAHNGAFDTLVCTRVGLMTDKNKKWFDCHVESETEFLTRTGWKRYDEIADDEELGTLHKGKLVWQIPSARVDKPFNGDAYVVETRYTRAVITGNHRMLHAPVQRSSGKRKPWKFAPLEEMLEGPDRAMVYRAAPRAEQHRGYSRRRKCDDSRGVHFTDSTPRSPLLCPIGVYTQMLGLFIADGSFRWRGDELRGIVISQKERGRAAKLLRAVAKRVGFKRYKSVHNESWRSKPCTEIRWVLDDPTMARYVLRDCRGRYSKDRRLPDWVWNTHTGLRKKLWEGLLAGDGSEHGKTIRYKTFSRALADDVQALTLGFGWPSTIHHEGETWVVNVCPELPATEQIAPRLKNDGKRRSRANVEKIQIENDRIVCFTVPNETLVTRSRGKPAYYGNTMVAHHDTDHNDLPHTLGFVTTRFLETPMWKQDVDHKDANCERDADLHLYNARDVLCTLRIARPLRDRVIACATGMQFNVDTSLAPNARDMQRLGVFINEYERGRLSVKFNKLTYKFASSFKEQVRKISKNVDDINPNSPPQLASWLYDELGLDPVINTQGYDWQEGDAASTSAEALIRLSANGVEPDVAAALDALMQFKACEKIRSTYIDNLHVRQLDEFNHLPKVKAARFLLNSGDVEAYAKQQGMELREAAKRVGKWHEMLPERNLLSIINPTWKIHVVPTGRWSSSPNVQNWPSRAWGGVNTRTMVVAPPGHVIIGADYAQIELRLYALQSGDEFLLRAFRDKRHGKDIDPHTLNAATLLTKDDSDDGIWREYDRINAMDKDEKKYYRTVAKRFVYLECYGGEEGKLFSVMSSERDKATHELVFPDILPDDCQRWHKNWHRLHPWTKEWQNACARYQRAHGFVEALVDGRKRYFLGGPNKKNAVPNHTIQGSAAAITNQAVLKIADAIPFGCWSPYTGLCLQVHDYIGVYVPVEKAYEAARIIKRCMYTEIDGMPFPADDPVPTWDWAGQG